jgi:ABC-2 type transport system permease protein/oleandomycin transport system permease protein
MPGIMVQRVVFGASQTGVGLAEDLSKGMVDRFRSLPMARSAVLAGRTMGDAARNVLVIVLMTIVGVWPSDSASTVGFFRPSWRSS